MAVNGNVCIKRGENMFYLSFAPIKMQYPEQPILEPDARLKQTAHQREKQITSIIRAVSVCKSNVHQSSVHTWENIIEKHVRQDDE